jgi:hypothetical protein
MSIDLSNYVDVAERIRLFFEAHPAGSIQATTPHPIIIQDSVFLEVTATVYRTPDDTRPSVATAWEPFPGTTPYTRNSEAMNCETSAAGRALAFLGFGVRRSVASAEDIANRATDPVIDTYARLKTLNPETKEALKKLAETQGKKLTAKAMHDDPTWHQDIIATINAWE